LTAGIIPLGLLYSLNCASLPGTSCFGDGFSMLPTIRIRQDRSPAPWERKQLEKDGEKSAARNAACDPGSVIARNSHLAARPLFTAGRLARARARVPAPTFLASFIVRGF
jgi:hypothetical protein